MTRKYGPLGTNIWGSDKFNRLSSDASRLSFIYLLSSDHTLPIGIFRLPPSYMADDRNISLEEARIALADLDACRMIELGENHWLRVKRWFYEETGPNNPDTAVKLCRYFVDRKLERAGPLVARGFGELLCATSQRASTWKQDSPGYKRMTDSLIEAAATFAQRLPDDLARSVAWHGEVEDQSLTHVVLDTASHRAKSPLINIVAAHVEHLSNTCPTGGVHVSDTETLKLTLKHKDTETPTGTGKPTGTPAPRTYPMTLDDHVAALNGPKRA